MADLCLSLICPPQVEEKLLDALLSTPEVEVFMSSPTFSHGTAQGRLTATEQVMGRSRSMQISVLLTKDSFDRLHQFLQHEFAGTGIRFWTTPVMTEGEFV